MPPADEESPDVRVVGGAEGRPRKPASDLSSIRARAGRAAPASAAPTESESTSGGSGNRQPREPRTTPSGDRSVDRRSYNLLVALTGLLAVMALLFGLAWGFGWGHDNTKKVVLSAGSSDVKAMSTVARTFVNGFTNYDPDGIDKVYNQINDLATGDFQKEWPALLPANVRQSIRTNRAQIRGEVRDFFVQGFNGTSGEVYAVSDVTYANNSSPQPIPDTLRFDIHLVQVDGAWKINQVDLLNSPTASTALGSTGGSGTSGSPGSTTTSTTPSTTG